MQLPRGRFHRLLKSTTPQSVLGEAGSTQFNGICTIAIGSDNAVLVFKEGKVLLAEYGGRKGQYALDEVMKSGEHEVAAELNLLSPEQIKLALEFNRPFTVEAPGGTEERAPQEQKKTASPVSVPKVQPRPEVQGQKLPLPKPKPEQKGASPTSSEHEDIDVLIQSMENMDVEQLVSSFRVNCKDMLKRIHMDHLIQDGDA
jgi:hypothetical protein